MNTVDFLIEDETGHSTEQIPTDKVEEEVNKHLKDGKWVTIEKKDGTSTLLTEPKKEETNPPTSGVDSKSEKKGSDWKNLFGTKKDSDFSGAVNNIKSCSVNNKMKGG